MECVGDKMNRMNEHIHDIVWQIALKIFGTKHTHAHTSNVIRKQHLLCHFELPFVMLTVVFPAMSVCVKVLYLLHAKHL